MESRVFELYYITLLFNSGLSGLNKYIRAVVRFQEELRADGYENIVIIAIGQTNTAAFNSNFCNNSDLPLVMDQYPSFPIRNQFSPYGEHKQVVILDYDGSLLDAYTLTNGLNLSAKNYITDVIAENYQEEGLVGDINGDEVINVQDIILTINLILSNQYNQYADLNSDGLVNILDVVQLVNIILDS